MIPANVTSELAALQAQVAAAEPLSSASHPTIVALQLNSEQLVTDVDAALSAAAGTLDTWASPVDPNAIVAGVLGLVSNANDQSSLATMRGYVGRSAATLNQFS